MEYLSRIVNRLSGHSLVRSGAIVLVGSMAANVGAYLYHLIIGRILGPERYGELGALLSLFYILNVPSGVVQNVLTKYFSVLKARGEHGQAKSMFTSATNTIVLVSLTGLVMTVVLTPALSRFLRIEDYSYVIWLYISFAFFLLTTVNIGALQGYQQFTAVTLYANISTLLRLIFGVAFAFFGVGWTLIASVLSNAVAYATYIVPLAFLLKRRKEKLTITGTNIASYSLPTFLAVLGISAIYSMDVLLVKHYFPAREAGIYASLSVLGKIIFFASSAVGQVIFPVVAERSELKEGHNRLVYASLGGIAALSFVVTGFYFLFPMFVVHLLFGSAFDEAARYVGPFGAFMSFFSLSFLLMNVNLAAGKTSVWVFTIGAALLQATFIGLFHGSLGIVTQINLAVTAVLCIFLLLYYRHGKSRQ